MGKFVKKVLGSAIFKVIDPALSDLLGFKSRREAQEAEDAARAHADAAIAAADRQTAAIKAASEAQVAQVNQQARGAAQAQQSAINQANLAAKLRTQEQQNNQAPQTKVEIATGANDPNPRRKYRGAGGGSVGGTGSSAGGIGIRLT